MLDSLPELWHYRDEGCALYPSCLHCPFPSCLDDEPRGRQRWGLDQRRKEMVRLQSEGKTTRQMAAIMGVSQRTVQRALKTNGAELSLSGNNPRPSWGFDKLSPNGSSRPTASRPARPEPVEGCRPTLENRNPSGCSSTSESRRLSRAL